MPDAPPEADALPVVHGQPSWRVAADAAEAFVTRRGGHLGPVTFRLGDRTVQPYAVAPWAEEGGALPPVLEVLRGDFFCLPFGGGDAFEGEAHPPHGETANADWHFVAAERTGDGARLHLRMDTTVRPGRVDKHVALRDGHAALYVRHVVSGMTGPMSFGHHAMLRFPDREGSGLVATSPFVWGRTAPEPVERPEARGYSRLAVDAPFASLEAVPTLGGGAADLGRYPLHRGFEDLVLLASDPALAFAWTAVTFPAEGYVWVALKDPRVLRQTVLWLSNGGRHYAPWSGRHVNVLGLEEVTSYFHYGLARSARPNALAGAGSPTHVVLAAARPLDVRSVAAVAAVPAGFDHVAGVAPVPGEEAVVLTARSGAAVRVPLDHGFVAA